MFQKPYPGVYTRLQEEIKQTDKTDCFVFVLIYQSQIIIQGPNLKTKIALQKNESVGRKKACHRLKHFQVLLSILVNLRQEFMKHVIIILFNLALIVVVFSELQFILFIHFASNDQRRTMKNFRIPGGVKFFPPQCDLMGHPVLNIKLCSKTTLYHKNQQHSNMIQ